MLLLDDLLQYETCSFTDVPETPAAPVVSDACRTSCEVSWQPPANHGGSPIIGYLLERCSGTSGPWIRDVREVIITTNTKITDLIEGNMYQFRVIAANKAGLSKPSHPSVVIMTKDQWSMYLCYYICILIQNKYCLTFEIDHFEENC